MSNASTRDVCAGRSLSQANPSRVAERRFPAGIVTRNRRSPGPGARERGAEAAP